VRDPSRRPPIDAAASQARRILIELRQGDPLGFEGDALVVPTVSEARMVEPLAARVKSAAGREVEEEAVRSAPIAVGAAVVTGAGTLPVRQIIHVPLVEQPGMKVGVENIRRATRAGLLAANHFQLPRIAIPGFGYGELGVPYDEAARAIIDEVRAFRGQCPQGVALIDTDVWMLVALREELGVKV
jgi:O-acetyl-ADP-ribose deacetylase (regulator of RNase III)